jgi:hypothetical protein
MTKHGDRPKGKKKRLYNIWLGMRERCNNKGRVAFARYGGRGISVCDEWNDYENFKAWALSSGYAENLTLERNDNNGNYSPDNCRWATSKEQANNRCSNRILEINGITHNIQKWCEITGLPRGVADGRLSRGWSAEKTFTTPLLTKGGKARE